MKFPWRMTCGRTPSLLWAAAFAIGATIGLATALPAPRASAQSADRPAVLHDPNGMNLPAMALPILNFQGEDDVCDTWIEVQYLAGGSARDSEPCDDAGAKAMLVVWGEPGFCPPQAAGPMMATCTGLLRPGAAWTISSATGWGYPRGGIPTGSRSGMLFLFTARRFSEIGLDDVMGFDAVTADYLCGELGYLGMSDDSNDYRRFLKAYREGNVFAGIPLRIAVGGGRLAVNVRRRCPSEEEPGDTVESSYAGIPHEGFGNYDPVLSGFSYALPLILATEDGLHTAVYAQNAGLDCAEIELWFRDEGACGAARLCDRQALAPGESVGLHLEACAGPSHRGSAWIWSSEPLAVAADVIGSETMATYTGRAGGRLEYWQATEDGRFVSFGPPHAVYGSVILNQVEGWSTDLHVQNLDQHQPARVAVEFHGPDGEVAAVLHEWLCPGGSRSIAPAAIHALPAGWTGSVTLESRPWWVGEGPTIQPAELAAVAVLRRSIDGAVEAEAGRWTEAAAYNLLPESARDLWLTLGRRLPPGAARLALPALTRAARGQGRSSMVAVSNLAREIGHTRVGFYLYDQSGLIDQECLRLANAQTARLDLDRWGFLSPGFRGAAIVSASAWTHAAAEPAIGMYGTRASLGAVVLDRAGEDRAGDAASASEALALDTAFRMAGNLCAGLRRLPRCPAE